MNNITIKNRYTLSLISELTDRFKKKSYYIKLDLCGIYNLIYMKEGEKWKMIFQIKYRHYKYTIILFGLTNVSATIQNLINNILKKYLDRFYIIYLDNILIFSDNKKEYKKYITTILKILKKIRLKIKFKKYTFHINKIEYLGFIIINQGLRINPAKIQIIRDWKILENIKKLLLFLKFTNFYRKFIKKYLSITVLLINLTKNNILWVWDHKEEETFNKLKKQFNKGKILIPFNTSKEIVVKTNVLDYIIRVIIS